MYLTLTQQTLIRDDDNKWNQMLPFVVGKCAIFEYDESWLPAMNVIGPFAQISFQFGHRTVDVIIRVITVIAMCVHHNILFSHFSSALCPLLALVIQSMDDANQFDDIQQIEERFPLITAHTHSQWNQRNKYKQQQRNKKTCMSQID